MKEIILFLLLFSYINSNDNNSVNDTSPFDEKELQVICSKCRSGFNNTYIDNEKLDNISDTDKINGYVINLVELLKTNFTSDQLMDEYVTPRVIKPNIIFIVLLALLIIIWIVLIVLVCLNKKVFNFEHIENEGHLKHHILAYITALCFIIILILSSIILPYIYESQTYFNGAICSILRIYIDLRDGDQAGTTQWKGTRQLQRNLVGDKEIENQLMNEINILEEITNELTNNKYRKKTFDENEKNKYSDLDVPSPNSYLSRVYPKYSKKREDYINKIYLEYINELDPGVKANENINDNNKPLKEDKEILSMITKENLYINSKLNDLLETVHSSAEEYLQYLIDYTRYANNILFPLLYSIFIISIILSIVGIIITLFYIRNNKLSLKVKKIFAIILHFLWNFILFLLLLTIISQVIFKIFGIVGEDVSGLLQYGTSKENFESSDSVIFTGAGKVFLETCFRDDETGNLLKKILGTMEQGTSMLETLNGIYIRGKGIILEKYYEDFQKIKLDKTQEIINELENMLNDYSLISYYNNKILSIEKNCQDDFDDLNRLTDYSNPLNSVQSTFSDKHSYDKWVSIKQNCEEYKQYKYIDDQKNRIEGNKYCMVLEEFDKDVASNFYSQIKTKTLSNVDTEFEEYHQCLNNFKIENQKLLNENPNFIRLTKNYYNELLALKEKILRGLEHSQNILNLLNIIMGNANSVNLGYDIFTIMNCQFLKRDLKVFYYEMEELRGNSKPYLIMSIFILILLLSAAILVILNIYKYKKEDEDQGEQLTTDSINVEK